MGSNPTLSANFCGKTGEGDPAHGAPFPPRSTSADGANPGTPESAPRSDSALQAPDAKTFRIALDKIMPGYRWTVHRVSKGAAKIRATGTQTSGFNRLSTLEVSWSRNNHGDWFEARSAGFGLRAPWLGKNGDVTLARALRGLQDYYRVQAATYSGHERALAAGRSTLPHTPRGVSA